MTQSEMLIKAVLPAVKNKMASLGLDSNQELHVMLPATTQVNADIDIIIDSTRAHIRIYPFATTNGNHAITIWRIN